MGSSCYDLAPASASPILLCTPGTFREAAGCKLGPSLLGLAFGTIASLLCHHGWPSGPLFIAISPFAVFNGLLSDISHSFILWLLSSYSTPEPESETEGMEGVPPLKDLRVSKGTGYRTAWPDLIIVLWSQFPIPVELGFRKNIYANEMIWLHSVADAADFRYTRWHWEWLSNYISSESLRDFENLFSSSFGKAVVENKSLCLKILICVKYLWRTNPIIDRFTKLRFWV